MMAGNTYDIRKLAELAGVTVRAARYWVTRGLLPRPIGKGRSAHYTQEHLVRLQAIRALRSQRMPLNEVHRFVQGHSLAELESLAQAAPPQTAGASRLNAAAPQDEAPAAGNAPSPASHDGALPPKPPLRWDVYNLGRGLIIMCSVDEGPAVRQLAQDMYEDYRRIAARVTR